MDMNNKNLIDKNDDYDWQEHWFEIKESIENFDPNDEILGLNYLRHRWWIARDAFDETIEALYEAGMIHGKDSELYKSFEEESQKIFKLNESSWNSIAEQVYIDYENKKIDEKTKNL